MTWWLHVKFETNWFTQCDDTCGAKTLFCSFPTWEDTENMCWQHNSKLRNIFVHLGFKHLNVCRFSSSVLHWKLCAIKLQSTLTSSFLLFMFVFLQLQTVHAWDVHLMLLMISLQWITIILPVFQCFSLSFLEINFILDPNKSADHKY